MKIKYAILIAFAFGIRSPLSYSQSPCPSRALDVLFVVDATSSMREELAALPQNLQFFKTPWADADLYTGGLVFRDWMERFIYKDYPIKPGVDSTWHFLTLYPAVGGGDDAEPQNEMLHQAVHNTWRENAERLVIFLSDAPPRYPEHTDEACLKLAENGIRVIVLSPDGAGKTALDWQHQVSEATDGLFLDWEDPFWHEEVLALVCPNAQNDVREISVRPSSIKVYPNPAQGTTTIEAEGAFLIWDNQGRRMYERENTANIPQVLSLDGWAPGLYWVQGAGGAVEKLVVIE